MSQNCRCRCPKISLVTSVIARKNVWYNLFFSKFAPLVKKINPQGARMRNPDLDEKRHMSDNINRIPKPLERVSQTMDRLRITTWPDTKT